MHMVFQHATIHEGLVVSNIVIGCNHAIIEHDVDQVSGSLGFNALQDILYTYLRTNLHGINQTASYFKFVLNSGYIFILTMCYYFVLGRL
jgi:hypothetical protein